MISARTLLIAALLFVFVTRCDDDPTSFQVDYSLAEELLFDTTGVTATRTDSGLLIYQIQEGEGPLQVEIRDNIRIYYTMRLKSTGQVFESSYVNGITSPSQFVEVGSTANNRGDGFVEGIIGMRENEQRVVVIPPSESVYTDTIIVDLDLDSILD